MKFDPVARNALAARFKSRLQTDQLTLRENYFADQDPPHLLKERSQLIDGVMRDLWTELGLPSSLALVAVGGYGREELWPSSDVDLLLLLPEAPDSALIESLEQLIGLFWDIGLEIGHSVRTIQDCLTEAAGDLTVQTALVEARLLIGNADLFSEFSAKFRKALDPQA